MAVQYSNPVTSGLGSPSQPKPAGGVTGYDINGTPVENVDPSRLQTYQPGTGYSSGILFNAPPQGTQHPANSSLVTNQQVNLPSLPPPKNLVMTGATLTPEGYSSNFGEDPAAVAARNYDYEAKTRADQARLAQEARDKALASFASMSGVFGTGASGGGPTDADVERVRALEFGQAKDSIGRQKAAALQSFRDAIAGQGLMGSTLEGSGMGNIIGEGERALGDVRLNQAQGAVTRAQSVADRNADYQQQAKMKLLDTLSSLFSSAGSLY